MQVGRRTGLTLPPTSTFIASDGLENPGQLFDAAAIVEESPNASIDGSIEKGHDASTALADFAAAKQPKIKVRFSLGDDVAEQLDSAATGSNIKAQHPVRKLISGKNRESIDTMDLSSVSTAPSVTSLKQYTDANDDDEDHVEASRRRLERSEEMEIASVVAAAQKQQKSEMSSPIMATAPDMGYDDDEEEEDFMPPPPPDSPRHDDDDHVEEELHTQPDNDVDFPNTVDDEDNDDGAGYQVPHDDEDDDEEEDDDDEVKHSESTSNAQRREKEKRMEKLAAKKNKKKNGLDDSANDDNDAVKPKSKTKKKTNPYSTVFSPKGMPGPRTYKEIPLSDLKPETPEDTQTRRSKRIRTQPLEYWRGERQILGGNNFGDEYDGVKNMPVVIGIAKPDPTPYKKRKVVPIVSHQKKKGGDNKNHSKRGKQDEPAMIAADEAFDDRALREKLTVNEGKVAHLWDERIQETRGISKSYIYLCVCVLFLLPRNYLYIYTSLDSRILFFIFRCQRWYHTWRPQSQTTCPYRKSERSQRVKLSAKRHNPFKCRTKKIRRFQDTLWDIYYYHRKESKMPNLLDCAPKYLRW